MTWSNLIRRSDVTVFDCALVLIIYAYSLKVSHRPTRSLTDVITPLSPPRSSTSSSHSSSSNRFSIHYRYNSFSVFAFSSCLPIPSVTSSLTVRLMITLRYLNYLIFKIILSSKLVLNSIFYNAIQRQNMRKNDTNARHIRTKKAQTYEWWREHAGTVTAAS